MDNLRVNAEEAFKDFMSRFPNAITISIAMGETTKSHVAHTSPGVEVIEKPDCVVFQHPEGEPFEIMVLHGNVSSEGISVGNQDHDYIHTMVAAGEEFRFYRQFEVTPGTGLLQQVTD